MADPTEPGEPLGLLLCDDMIFTSRIVGTGRDLGLAVRAAKSPEALLALAGQRRPRCVIVDLPAPGLSAADFMARLAAACSQRPFVVAYGSHVDAATLRGAREAGCDLVWPRSKFVEELPREMPRWFGMSPGPG